MSLAGRLLVGLGLTVLVLGVSIVVLVQPWFTGLVASRVSEFSATGLTPERGVEVAQGVREYVAGLNPNAERDLPATVNGRAGFGPDERSHLADVARVIGRARLLTGLVGGALTIWLLVEVVRRRTAAVAQGLRMGAYMSAGFMALAAVVGLASFDRVFTAFHGLFFAEGTWTFPADSLLIQLFPEPFWMTAGLAWVGFVLLGAAALWLAALWLERSSTESLSASVTV